MNDAPPDAVQSSYLGGQLTLWQSRTGYRAAIDPALLAASLDLKSGARAVEFGCGPGAALLSAAVLNPEVFFLGIEQDAAAATLADRNRLINACADRTGVICADIMDWKGKFPDPGEAKPDLKQAKTDLSSAKEGSTLPIDAIFFNPPFFDDAATLRAPAEAKTEAWINATSVSDWIALALRRLREGGRLTLIQRADRLGDILAALSPKAGGVQVLPVHPKADAPAKRVIVSATKTSKAPLQILPALILHQSDGSYTPEVDAILRGEGRTELVSARR